MLRYVYFGTNNLERAVAFYDATLAPLGMARCITGDPDWDRIAAGWGIYEDGGARELGFWIGIPFDQKPATVGNGSMVAFTAHTWKAVDDFHAAALAHWVIRFAARPLPKHLFLSFLSRCFLSSFLDLAFFVSFPCSRLIEARTRMVSALCV